MQNIILWMPNTALILDKNEPSTPGSFSRIPTSCFSNISTGKNNLLGCWSDPLHSPFSLSQLSSYVMNNLRRPQVPSQYSVPTKKISASTSSPGLADFVVNSQNSSCLMLDEDESHSPPPNPWALRCWASQEQSWSRAEGLCSSGNWMTLVCQPPLVILTYKENKRNTSYNLTGWLQDISSISFFLVGF